MSNDTAETNHSSLPARQPAEVVQSASKRVHCDGGGTLGHPRVYLEMGEKEHIDCPYCGRRFIYVNAH